ncbi:hypothetical protein [Sphingorhabdus sp. Alg239-R122]|uniref:hypothetical protein n=1 Tax=Sphingorhabdus sp. Alg239-R122 TaxID=2305989 RepID=UPI0013DD2677|nr:hypothetical protein [Sphingorhabdus sp. Alg239-R122]
MRSLSLALAFSAAVLGGPVTGAAYAEETTSDAQADILKIFTGTWKAEGTSFGVPSKSTMVWREALDGKFYRLTYTIEMQRDDKVQAFVGHGYYQRGSSHGFWADNGGDLHSMVTTYTGTQVSTIWGKAGGKQGRSSYTLRDDGKIEVIDWILTENGWREFNRTLFSQAD